MRTRVIRALVAKDMTLFFRNRFFALVTILGLVAYAVFYFVMPRTVDETLKIGLYAPVLPSELAARLDNKGVAWEQVTSEQTLVDRVTSRSLAVGIVLPAETVQKLATGERGQVRLYVSADLPPDLTEAYQVLLREFAFSLGGRPLNLDVSQEVLGPDMAGAQIPPRDRMRPLFAVFLLLVETMGLASLISAELEARTAQALLVTGMRVSELFAAKGITGVGLAFSEATLLLAVLGGLRHHPVLLLLMLLLGAVLVTGVGFLIASAARDLVSVMAWGILAFLILALPALGVLMPGIFTGWVKAIPSYYLVDGLHRVASFGVGWADVWPSLVVLLAWSLLLAALGIAALRRRIR